MKHEIDIDAVASDYEVQEFLTVIKTLPENKIKEMLGETIAIANVLSILKTLNTNTFIKSVNSIVVDKGPEKAQMIIKLINAGAYQLVLQHAISLFGDEAKEIMLSGVANLLGFSKEEVEAILGTNEKNDTEVNLKDIDKKPELKESERNKNGEILYKILN